MNITVYLGALRGNDPVLKDAVKELGTWIGKHNHTLIYGGSKSGLMGGIYMRIAKNFDNFVSECPYFNGNADVNNGYGCEHKAQKEVENGQGKCYC